MEGHQEERCLQLVQQFLKNNKKTRSFSAAQRQADNAGGSNYLAKGNFSSTPKDLHPHHVHDNGKSIRKQEKGST